MIKITLMKGHVLDCLKKIPDESVDMVVTSPPYFHLRKYPEEANVVWSEDKNCEHDFELYEKSGFCKKCGAWFGQLGLEHSPELYLQHLKQVMIEIKRVLKKTGTIFWNMGDTYFKKCLLMLPERFAWICISDLGLILRNKICWYKPNPLPSSVKDRFTNTWEYVFLFSKSRKYFFNLDAVRVPLKTNNNYSFNYRVREAKKGRLGKVGVVASKEEMEIYDDKGKLKSTSQIALEHGYDPEGICPVCGRKWKRHVSRSKDRKEGLREVFTPCVKQEKLVNNMILGKNPGDMWEISPQPFPEAHFSVFPEKLVRNAIRAGCPENGVVLDPFLGSGTTMKVAIEERRNCIGIEAVEEYCKMAMRRCNLPNPLIDFEYKVI